MTSRRSDTVERLFREEAPKLWRSLVAFAGDREIASDAVAEAFAQLLGRVEQIRAPDRWVWRAAFKIARGELKIIRSRADIKGAGWATAGELSAFTGSANHQGATGSEARRSRMKGDPPRRVITLPEADAFIGHLLTSWLASLPDR